MNPFPLHRRVVVPIPRYANGTGLSNDEVLEDLLSLQLQSSTDAKTERHKNVKLKLRFSVNVSETAMTYYES